MSSIKKQDGNFVINTKRYPEILLDEVAKKDPNYLIWLYENTAINLDDDSFYALCDTMEKHSIPLP